MNINGVGPEKRNSGKEKGVQHYPLYEGRPFHKEKWARVRAPRRGTGKRMAERAPNVFGCKKIGVKSSFYNNYYGLKFTTFPSLSAFQQHNFFPLSIGKPKSPNHEVKR